MQEEKMNSQIRRTVRQTYRLDWAIIIFMAAQTGAGIWWASSVSTSQLFLKEQVRYLLQKTEDRYTAEDARAMWNVQDQKNMTDDRRMLKIESKIERIEAQLFKLPKLESE